MKPLEDIQKGRLNSVRCLQSSINNTRHFRYEISSLFPFFLCFLFLWSRNYRIIQLTITLFIKLCL